MIQNNKPAQEISQIEPQKPMQDFLQGQNPESIEGDLKGRYPGLFFLNSVEGIEVSHSETADGNIEIEIKDEEWEFQYRLSRPSETEYAGDKSRIDLANKRNALILKGLKVKNRKTDQTEDLAVGLFNIFSIEIDTTSVTEESVSQLMKEVSDLSVEEQQHILMNRIYRDTHFGQREHRDIVMALPWKFVGIYGIYHEMGHFLDGENIERRADFIAKAENLYNLGILPESELARLNLIMEFNEEDVAAQNGLARVRELASRLSVSEKELAQVVNFYNFGIFSHREQYRSTNPDIDQLAPLNVTAEQLARFQNIYEHPSFADPSEVEKID